MQVFKCEVTFNLGLKKEVVFMEEGLRSSDILNREHHELRAAK